MADPPAAPILPKGLTYEESGKILCVVCSKYVPAGDKSISTHLNGKRHDIAAKRAAQSSPNAMNNLPVASPSQAPAETNDKPVSIADDSDSDVIIVENESPETKNSTLFDKEAYIASILASIGKSNESNDLNSDADSNGSEDDAKANEVSAKKRLYSAFAPLEYRPADGVDNFFDCMPSEELRTGTSKKLRALLDSATPKKPQSRIGKTDTPTSLPLKVNTDSDGERKPEAANGNGDTGNEKNQGQQEEDNDELPPWLLGADAIEAVRYSRESSLALHYDILEFARFMSPTENEREIREKIVTTMQNIIKTIWPDCRLEMFGSYATDLFLPSSDIDMCVMGTPEDGSMEEMEKLASAVRNVEGFARRVNVIKARVSLVKLVAREGGVQCDISFGQSNGPKNVPIIRQYLQDYPALRPLLLVVKCFLQQRSLNEVYSGGLGSYGVLLLVVSHLQMVPYNFMGMKANLGMALQQFFQLYGRLFNYCVAGIAVKDNGSYFNKVQRYDTLPGDTIRYSMEDPNEVENEIGPSSFAAPRVRKAFANAYSQLNTWRRDDSTHPISPLSTIIVPDKALRGRRKQVLEDFQSRNVLSLEDFTRANVGTFQLRQDGGGGGAYRSDSMARPAPSVNYGQYNETDDGPYRGAKSGGAHYAANNGAGYNAQHASGHGSVYPASYMAQPVQQHQGYVDRGSYNYAPQMYPTHNTHTYQGIHSRLGHQFDNARSQRRNRDTHELPIRNGAVRKTRRSGRSKHH